MYVLMLHLFDTNILVEMYIRKSTFVSMPTTKLFKSGLDISSIKVIKHCKNIRWILFFVHFVLI